jgi:hypothetical protein
VAGSGVRSQPSARTAYCVAIAVESGNRRVALMAITPILVPSRHATVTRRRPTDE